MPFFWFDTDDGYSFVQDDEGCEVFDLHAAQKLALEAIMEIASTRLTPNDQRLCTIFVRDAAGRGVYRAKVEVTSERIQDPTAEI